MTQQALLSVFIDESLCDNVTDIMMGLDACAGFTLTQVNGYSKEHAHYDVKEQVVGYRQLYRLDIMHVTSELFSIKSALASIGSDRPMRYWVTPIAEQGVIK